jgi:mannosyltransferase
MRRRLDGWLGPALVAALALALRLYGLEAQSLWADEGGTLVLAARDPATILRDTLADVHPPLYYWLLHAWMGLFGPTAAAARGLSALCGAAVAFVTGLLGRRWSGEIGGLVAGVAAAVSPLAIHYSQEARMYALAALLAALLFLALDAWLARPTWPRLGMYLLAALALASTHYFAATAVAAAGLVGAAQALRAPAAVAQGGNDVRQPLPARGDRPRSALIFLAAHLPLAAIYLATVLASRSRLAGWTAAKDATPPWLVLGDALRSFSVGLSAPPGWEWWSVVYLALLLAGLTLPWRTGERQGGRLAAALWLGLPLAAIALISLGQPYYKPRFLLMALPAFHVLIGAGAAQLLRRLGLDEYHQDSRAQGFTKQENSKPSRFLGASRLRGIRPAPFVRAGLLSLIALSASAPLYNEWFDPAYWRDDYRGAARVVAATIGPGDALILNGQSQIETLDYYLQTPHPRILLPRARPLDPVAVTADLEQLSAQHRRIYGLFYVIEEADPQGVIAGWLDAHSFPSGARWYGALLLRTWETGDIAGRLRPAEARFAGWLRASALAADQGERQPGDGVRAQVVWQAEGGPAAGLNIFLHLVDARGQLAAQYDGPLVTARQDAAAGSWTTRAAVIIPPGTPPGAYRLVLGVYDPASGERLGLEGGADTLELAVVQVR